MRKEQFVVNIRVRKQTMKKPRPQNVMTLLFLLSNQTYSFCTNSEGIYEISNKKMYSEIFKISHCKLLLTSYQLIGNGNKKCKVNTQFFNQQESYSIVYTPADLECMFKFKINFQFIFNLL